MQNITENTVKNTAQTAAEPKTLRQLFGPICLETLFYMLAGMADTLMLSAVSNEAVGAVGTANTYINMFIILFGVVSTGMVAVMTQYIGAGRPGIAWQARQLGLAFNAVLGAALSLLLFFGCGPVLGLMGVAPRLLPYARDYLRIVGGCCIFNAVIPILASYLRAFGHTRWPLAATVLANVLNVILNAVFLFVLHWGVAGVALATAIARGVNVLVLAAVCRWLVRAARDPDRLPGRTVLRQILRVGLPSAAETALYNVAMALVVRFLNQMDSAGLNVTARSYVLQISNFSYCVSAALSQANAILVGWRIGAQNYDVADRGTRRAAVVGMASGAGVAALFAAGAPWLMRLFTNDPAMIALVGRLLAVDIALEVGKAGNLVYGNALKTGGDALYTTFLAAVFMSLCAVGGSWQLGLRLGWGAVGAMLGLAADECCRAVGMGLRWHAGYWRRRELISR